MVRQGWGCERRERGKLTYRVVSFAREHSITQDYEREFRGAGVPLHSGAGRAEPHGRRSIEAVDLESEVRRCPAVRTAGPAACGLVQRLWSRRGLAPAFSPPWSGSGER